jgi:RNA polymerase primary sigma factor
MTEKRTDEKTLHSYFTDIAASTPLSRAEESELAVRIQRGDQEARNQLVEANLRFVVEVAKQYQHRGLSLPDLISAGNMGLIKAAARFDSTRGYKFITYAVWWIRQSIQHILIQDTHTVRLPANQLLLLKAISRAVPHRAHAQPNEAEMEGVSVTLDRPVEHIRAAVLMPHTTHSLDDVFSDEEPRHFYDILPDLDQEPTDSETMKAADSQAIRHALSALNEREHYILAHYYGLEDHTPKTLAEVGVLMGLTRERVRQLKERALGKLRHPQYRQTLRELMVDG